MEDHFVLFYKYIILLCFMGIQRIYIVILLLLLYSHSCSPGITSLKYDQGVKLYKDLVCFHLSWAVRQFDQIENLEEETAKTYDKFWKCMNQ